MMKEDKRNVIVSVGTEGESTTREEEEDDDDG